MRAISYKRLSAIVMAAVMAGCARPGLDYAQMRQELLGESLHVASETKLPLPAQLTVPEAKRLALSENLDLKALAARIRGAEFRRRQAYAAYFPSLVAGASATHTEMSPGEQVFGGTTFINDGDPYETYGGTLTLSWLAFDALTRDYEILAAKYGVESTTAARQDAQRLLARGVATAFYAALLAQKQMQIAKADQDFNQAFLGDTQKRFDQGTVPRSEVLNFQIRLDNARISFIEAESSYQIACVVLAELMGYPGADLAAQTSLVEPPVAAAPVPALAAEISAALADRPDLRRLMADVQVDQALIRARYGDFWPRVNLVGQYGLSNPDPVFSEHDQSLWYGVESTWNLFSGGRTYYTWKAAQEQAEATTQTLRRQWQAVVSEIRQEVETLRKATAKIAIQEQIVTATRTIREDVEKAYKAGQVSLTRLNEAQRDLIVADQSLAVTQVQLLLSRENLAAATGANLRDVPVAP